MEEITLVKDAIHRPEEPRHFMEYAFPETQYVASIGSRVIADSKAALKLSEVGYHIYDPVIYFPLADVQMNLLRETEKSTHCPLKGDTCYYDFADGESEVADIAWRYAKPFDFAAKLENYVGFDRRFVTIVAAGS